MEQAQSLHRCVNVGCGRAFPRRVDFCPWCGTAQRPAAAPIVPPAPDLAKRPEPVVVPPPAPVPPPAAPIPPPPPPPRPPAPPVPPPIRPSAAPRPAAPARKPIRLRWWLIALGILWLAWMLTKPTQARIERRMSAAIALAKECKPKQAQDELIALRKTRASDAQLRKVQDALNAAAAACTREERRRRSHPLADPKRGG
jgi:hypothetical protein